MAVTIREVADEAGVSITAVSKVLHGRGGSSIRVSKRTERLIREAAEKLSYVPNALAQALRMNRTRNVGLVFENFGEISAGPLYYVYLLDGVAQVLFKHHYRLTILSEITGDVLSSLGDGSLDGVLWCKLARDEKSLEQISRCPVPLVALNTPPPDNPHDLVFVACDNEGGARLVVRHLAELGHERILFVFEENEHTTPDATARAEGFARACREAGLPAEERDFVCWSREVHEFADWWESSPPHTAIFAWNERIAGTLLERARACGVSIPNELSVVGFDSTRYCDQTQPRLTAVRQPIHSMASQATSVLLAAIEGAAPSRFVITFPCSLDVRESTAPPRSIRTSFPLSAEAQSL